MFAVSRAEFKGDDDADARCTAVGFTVSQVVLLEARGL